MKNITKAVCFGVGAIFSVLIFAWMWLALESAIPADLALFQWLMLGCLLCLSVILFRLSLVWGLYALATTNIADGYRQSALSVLFKLSPKLAKQVSATALLSSITVTGSTLGASALPAEQLFEYPTVQVFERNNDLIADSSPLSPKNGPTGTKRSVIQIPTVPRPYPQSKQIQSPTFQTETNRSLPKLGKQAASDSESKPEVVAATEISSKKVTKATKNIEVITGDSLWGILSKEFATDNPAVIQAQLVTVLQLNPQIANPNLIFPGQQILIPSPPQ